MKTLSGPIHSEIPTEMCLCVCVCVSVCVHLRGVMRLRFRLFSSSLVSDETASH